MDECEGFCQHGETRGDFLVLLGDEVLKRVVGGAGWSGKKCGGKVSVMA